MLIFDELSKLDATNQEKSIEIIEAESKLVPSLKALDIIGFSPRRSGCKVITKGE